MSRPPRLLLTFCDDSTLIFAVRLRELLRRAAPEAELTLGCYLPEEALSLRQLEMLVPEAGYLVLNKDSLIEAVQEGRYDAVLTSRVFRSLSNFLGTPALKHLRGRSQVISFLGGLDFFPERGYANRMPCDGVFLFPRSDVEKFTAHAAAQAAQDSHLRAPLVDFGHPTFLAPAPVPPADLAERRDIYFFAQAISPLTRRGRLHVLEAMVALAEAILSTIGRGRRVLGIGIGFTASSPLPALADGTPLSSIHPEDPHAYVKLWKHGAAQLQADRINQAGGAFLEHFGGRVSAEWLLAKAAQIADEAPQSWERTGRFIEAGDWLVWQLTGKEVRSLGFAAYKAQYDAQSGYPDGIVTDLSSRLSTPVPIGSKAGELTQAWQQRTGIIGPCAIAVAVIDSHVVLPAIGAVDDGCFVGALGTSAVSLMLSRDYRPLPAGIEGTAFDGSIRGLWCYEAGQASFGDTLNWFVRNFPQGDDLEASFAFYNAAAARLEPGESRLLALDWWNGNRVPHANSALSGLLLGLSDRTEPTHIYRALMESLCFGKRLVFELYQSSGFQTERVVMTSGLASRNPLLVQIMADVLGRDIAVPEIANPTAVGAAIHGAVAAGVVDNFADGAARFGAKTALRYQPDTDAFTTYSALFQQYQVLSRDPAVMGAMRVLGGYLSIDVTGSVEHQGTSA